MLWTWRRGEVAQRGVENDISQRLGISASEVGLCEPCLLLVKDRRPQDPFLGKPNRPKPNRSSA